MRYPVRAIFFLAVAALLLGGCTDMKRALGMEKVVPDEFAVVQSAPLALPPDYSLRPPRPGARPTQEVSSAEQARQTIFRAGDQQQVALPDADKRSAGENELLRQAGAASAPRDIRDVVNKEAAQTTTVDESFVDKLLFWREADRPVGITDAVINPQQESERLKAAQAGAAPPAGAPATRGQTGAATPSAAPAPELLGPPTIERDGSPKAG